MFDRRHSPFPQQKNNCKQHIKLMQLKEIRPGNRRYRKIFSNIFCQINPVQQKLPGEVKESMLCKMNNSCLIFHFTGVFNINRTMAPVEVDDYSNSHSRLCCSYRNNKNDKENSVQFIGKQIFIEYN